MINFLEKVASFADQYSNTVEGEEGILLKIASDMDVTYSDMVALHNITSANVFTGEGLEKIAEDAEPSRIALVGDIWEKIASDEIGAEGIALAAEGIDMSHEDIEFVLGALDKQAEEAGVDFGADPAEEAGIVADDETWEKVAEAHAYLADANIDVMSALDFAVDMANAEDEDAGDKVAAEYEDLDDEMFDKIAQAVDHLDGIDGAYDLMGEYDKEAKNIMQKGADFLYRDRKGAGDAIKETFSKYKAAVTGAGSGKVKKRIKLNEKRIAGSKNSNQKRSLTSKVSADNIRSGAEGKSAKVKSLAESLAAKKDMKGRKTMKSLNERQTRRKTAIIKDKKSLKQIRTTQAKAIGGTAAVVGAGTAGAYNAATSKK